MRLQGGRRGRSRSWSASCSLRSSAASSAGPAIASVRPDAMLMLRLPYGSAKLHVGAHGVVTPHFGGALRATGAPLSDLPTGAARTICDADFATTNDIIELSGSPMLMQQPRSSGSSSMRVGRRLSAADEQVRRRDYARAFFAKVLTVTAMSKHLQYSAAMKLRSRQVSAPAGRCRPRMPRIVAIARYYRRRRRRARAAAVDL